MQQTDFRPLVRAAVAAGAAMLAVKAAVVPLVANGFGATVALRRFAGVLPYWLIESDPATFAAIVTVSTVAMAIAAAGLVVRPALVGGWRHQVVWGRGLGAVIAAETLVLELVRNRLAPPVVLADWVWAPAGLTVVATVALAVALQRADRMPESLQNPA